MHFNAMFTLSLSSKHNLSQSAVDHVVSSTEVLLQSHLKLFKENVKSKLAEMHVDPAGVDDVVLSTCMSEFESHSKRMAYYRKNVSTYIEPEEVILGYRFLSKSGGISRTANLGYIIPFQKSVENFLSMPEVWWHVQNSHQTVNLSLIHI